MIKIFPKTEFVVKTFEIGATLSGHAVVTENLNIGKGWKSAIVALNTDKDASAPLNRLRWEIKLWTTEDNDDSFGSYNREFIVITSSYTGPTYFVYTYRNEGKSYLLDGSGLTNNNQGNIRGVRINSAKINGEQLDIEIENTFGGSNAYDYDIHVYLVQDQKEV